MDNGFDQNGLYKGISVSPNLARTGSKILLKKKGAMATILIIIIAAGAFILLTPMLVIGTIKENLFSKLGFKNTVAIIEKVAEYKIGNYLKSGHMPNKLADDFAIKNMEVGQVTLAGDFVRTNDYIADLNGTEVAASGEYYNNDSGSLVIKFGNMIIDADNFVATVESTPELYAAYSEALDVPTRFYYSDDVNSVYKNMGINRNAFGSWKSSGDDKTDEENFNEILSKLLDGNYETNTAGRYKDWELVCEDEDGSEVCWWEYEWVDWERPTTGSESEIAKGLVNAVASGSRNNEGSDDGFFSSIIFKINEKTGEHENTGKVKVLDKSTGEWKNPDEIKQSDQTTDENSDASQDPDGSSYFDSSNFNMVSADMNATQLLNTTISSAEPFLAANAFMAIVEPIEQAQVGNNGPVNYLMNALTKSTKITYDGETESKSILETSNFIATVGDGPYSKEEANKFASRDRMLISQNLDKDEYKYAINSTVVSADNRKQSGLGIVMYNNKEGDITSANLKTTASSNVENGLIKKNSETFRSVVGGNRAIEGGSFLSNDINKSVLGAMPSDNSTIMAYQQEVNEIIARQTEADRATKSPFDISSPNTFMGNLIRNIASVSINFYGSNSNISLSKTISAATNLANSSISNLLTGNVIANGNDNQFTTIAGDCETVKIAANVEGDLYCNSHNTLSTINMNYTDADWRGTGIGVGANGEIDDDSELARFILLAMDRESTVGVRSYEVCDRYIENTFNFFQRFINFITTGANNLEQKCNNVPLEIANGSIYTFSSDNKSEDEEKDPRKDAELYSAYVLHDAITSLLEEKESEVTAFRKTYYEKHPLDDSYEGKLARISGLSKSEVSIALAYAEHLSAIANYNPANRYAFGWTLEPASQKLLIDDSEVEDATYYAWFSRIDYYDVRNRVAIV